MKRSIVIFSGILLLSAGCSNVPRSSAPDEGTPNLNTTIIGDSTISGSSGTRGATSTTSDESH
jgi:hypothetical protein